MHWFSSVSFAPIFSQTIYPRARCDKKICSLGELLLIKDSKRCSESKLDVWKALNFHDITASTFPPHYCEDAKRFTMHVNNISFIHPYNDEDTESRFQRINNTTLSTISAMDDCPLANTTRGVHVIRYLVQDLLGQGIFAIDPDFLAQNVDTYEAKGVLLLPHQEGACRESSFSIMTEGNILSLVAIQYWKVVNKLKPTELRGHDGLKIHISINLAGATEGSIVERFQDAHCFLQFHGFRKTLDEIKF